MMMKGIVNMMMYNIKRHSKILRFLYLDDTPNFVCIPNEVSNFFSISVLQMSVSSFCYTKKINKRISVLSKYW